MLPTQREAGSAPKKERFDWSVPVTLKVIEVHAPAVARAAGISEDRSLAGCVRTWHRCWSLKSDVLTRVELAGMFGSERLPEIIEALEVEFLERLRGGKWRVRGCDKYLRIARAQSEAGKAHIQNLKKGSKRRENPGSAPGSPGGSPDSSAPATPPAPPGSTTDHRSPITESVVITEPPPPKHVAGPLEQPATAVVVVGKELFQPPDDAARWSDEQLATETGFWSFIQACRATRRLAREPEPPKGYPSWHRDAFASGATAGELADALKEYFSDTDFEAKGWPTAIFISPKVWTTRIPHRKPRHDRL